MSSLQNNLIIITCKVHPGLITKLESKGMQIIYQPHMDYDQLIKRIATATGLIVSTSIPIDQPLIDQSLQLKWIARMGSGMEHIDVAYAKQKGIQCVSSPEGNSRAVAEFTIGLILSLFRNIHQSSREVTSFIWEREKNRGPELTTCKIGIVGYGNTGGAVVDLLIALGAQILVYDKYKKDFGNEKIREVSWEQIVSDSDLISFHIPLNEETHHLMNASFFDSLKRQPYLINASRGSILDTAALIEAIEKKQIKGAALDVLENEKLSSLTEIQSAQLQKLLSFSNVIITPHLAGYSTESVQKMGEILLSKLGMAL